MELSLNQSLPPELRIMSFQLRMMERIGLVGPQGRFYRFALAFGWGAFVKLVPKIVLGMGSSQFGVIIKGLSELLYQLDIYVPVALVVLNLSSFKRMIHLMSEIVRQVTHDDQSKTCYDLIREQNSKINKFSKLYFIYCCIGSLVYCVPAMATSYVRYYGTNNNSSGGNGSEPLQFELSMEQEFYGLQIRTNFAHYHVFMACSLLSYYAGGYLSTIKVTAIISGIRYSSLAYRLVAIQVRELNDTGSTRRKKKIATSDIEAIVQLHTKAFEITDLLEDMISIPLAAQFLSCLLFWCLVMFYASMDLNINLINVMIPFCLSMIETYGYAYLGSELTAEAQTVGQAVYELPWYEDSVELQRYYNLIILRSQRATGVTAVKFFPVEIDKFGSLLQMSYSYYLVLKDVLQSL